MLIYIDPDECFGRVHVCSGHFCEHDLNMIGRHANLSISLRKDGVRSTEADVGLEDIVNN